jgi:hypothetical protein
LAACALLPIASFGAAAFTFADGTHADCVARGEAVVEIDAAPGHLIYQMGYTGITAPAQSGYQITWNVKKLNSLPAVVHDFIFFHECAHARIPTSDELQANCAGLKDMRAAGRAGFAVEAKLAAFYGLGNDYWARTLKCANAEGVWSTPEK